MKKAIVIGGGIGGVEAAIRLKKQGLQVELISDREDLYIYPLSIWIPTGETTPTRIRLPLKDIARRHGFSVRADAVTGIDASRHSITLTQETVVSDFDYLVIAVGAGKMSHPGKEHTLSICGPPEEALMLKEKIAGLIARGSGTIAVGFGGNPKDTSAVRGGPAFEFLFNIHHLLNRKKRRENFTLVFFAPMKTPGIRLGEKALGMMDRMFAQLDIRQKTGVKITAFAADGIRFQDGSRIPSDVTMFIPAGDGHPVIKASDLPCNAAGFIKITPTCQVKGIPWMYAVGDAAALEEEPWWRAKQGHLAEQMARAAANDIALREGNRVRRTSYRDHLNILCLMDMGNGAALVYRNHRRVLMLPMPVVGHWLKKAWGVTYKLSKLKWRPVWRRKRTNTHAH